MKIVLVGAGSREFGPASIRDILLSDPLCHGGIEIALVDIDPAGLPRTQAYAESVAYRLHRSATVTSTTRLADALPGADAVILAIEVNRYFYWAQDFHVPRTFGFRQIYGENGGPGGLFHALRNMGPTVDVARAIEAHCPDAWLVNYTNPLTKLSEAAARLADIRVVGLCHGVFRGVEQMARILELPPERLDARASGLNHFTWFTSLVDRETGADLYPRLRERERAGDLMHDWDEMALSRILFRVFGRFPSPGANHIGEYIRWAGDFLGSSALQFFYDPAEGHPWETGKVPTWIYNLGDNPTDTPLFPDRPRHRARGSREERAGTASKPPGPPSSAAMDAPADSFDPLTSAPLAPSGELAVPSSKASCAAPNDTSTPSTSPTPGTSRACATTRSSRSRRRPTDPVSTRSRWTRFPRRFSRCFAPRPASTTCSWTHSGTGPGTRCSRPCCWTRPPSPTGRRSI